jgi:hypothetical protein
VSRPGGSVSESGSETGNQGPGKASPGSSRFQVSGPDSDFRSQVPGPDSPPLPGSDFGPCWRAAEAYGIDMTLIDQNLRRTPEERVHAHQMALELKLALREAGQHLYAEYDRASQTLR